MRPSGSDTPSRRSGAGPRRGLAFSIQPQGHHFPNLGMLIICPVCPMYHILEAGQATRTESCSHHQSLLSAKHVQAQAPHRLAQDQGTAGALS